MPPSKPNGKEPPSGIPDCLQTVRKTYLAGWERLPMDVLMNRYREYCYLFHEYLFHGESNILREGILHADWLSRDEKGRKDSLLDALAVAIHSIEFSPLPPHVPSSHPEELLSIFRTRADSALR